MTANRLADSTAARTARRRTTRALAALACVLAIPLAQGQTPTQTSAQSQAPAWPSKPLRLLVGFAPGGAVDIVARAVGQQLARDFTPTALLGRVPVVLALAAPEVRDRLANAGGEVLPSPVDRLSTLMASERQRYDRLIREARIKPD